KNGPMFNPPIVSRVDGPIAAMTIGTTGGGTNWPGGSFDPETNIAYLYAANSGVAPLGLVEPPPGFSDIRYVSGQAGQPFRVAEGDEHPEDRSAWLQHRHARHKDARRRRRRAGDDDRHTSTRRDAARVRQEHWQRSRCGLDARAAERIADDLHRQRQAVHSRR